MKLKVHWTRKQVNREIAEGNAVRAFNDFRHNGGSDYDFKAGMAFKADKARGGNAYKALAASVRTEALALSTNRKWVAAVEDWYAAHS